MDADGGWPGFETTLEPLEAYMKGLVLLPHTGHQTTGKVPACTVVWV